MNKKLLLTTALLGLGVFNLSVANAASHVYQDIKGTTSKEVTVNITTDPAFEKYKGDVFGAVSTFDDGQTLTLKGSVKLKHEGANIGTCGIYTVKGNLINNANVDITRITTFSTGRGVLEGITNGSSSTNSLAINKGIIKLTGIISEKKKGGMRWFEVSGMISNLTQSLTNDTDGILTLSLDNQHTSSPRPGSYDVVGMSAVDSGATTALTNKGKINLTGSDVGAIDGIKVYGAGTALNQGTITLYAHEGDIASSSSQLSLVGLEVIGTTGEVKAINTGFIHIKAQMKPTFKPTPYNYVGGVFLTGNGRIDLHGKSNIVIDTPAFRAFGVAIAPGVLASTLSGPTLTATTNIKVVGKTGAGIALRGNTSTASSSALISGSTIDVSGGAVDGIDDLTTGDVNIDKTQILVSGVGHGLVSHRLVGETIASSTGVNLKKGSVITMRGDSTGDGIHINRDQDGTVLPASPVGTTPSVGASYRPLVGQTVNVSGTGNGIYLPTLKAKGLSGKYGFIIKSDINILATKSGNAVKLSNPIQVLANYGNVKTVADKPAFDFSAGTVDYYQKGTLSATGKGEAVLFNDKDNFAGFDVVKGTGTTDLGTGVLDAKGGEDTLLLLGDSGTTNSSTFSYDAKGFEHISQERGDWILNHDITFEAGNGAFVDTIRDRQGTRDPLVAPSGPLRNGVNATTSGSLMIASGKTVNIMIDVKNSLNGVASPAKGGGILVEHGRTGTISANKVNIKGAVTYTLSDESWLALASFKILSKGKSVIIQNIYTKGGVTGQSAKTVTVKNAPKGWTGGYDYRNKRLGVKLINGIIIPATKIVPAKKVIPATKIVPAKKVIPATKIVPAKKVIPATKIVPAKKVIPATKIVPAKKVIPATKIVPAIKSCVNLTGGQLATICNNPRDRVDIDTSQIYRNNAYKYGRQASQYIHNKQIATSQFVDIIGNYNKYWNNNINADYDAYTYGVMGATVHKFAEDWVGGVQYGYTRSNVKFDDQTESNDNINSYGIGLYGSYSPDFWNFIGHVNYLFSSHDQKRRLEALRGDTGQKIDEVYKADYDSHIVSTGLQVSRDVALSTNWTLQPLASLDYSWIKQESYTEKGGSDKYRLHVDGQTTNSLYSRLGGYIRHDSGRFNFYGGMFWEHEYLNPMKDRDVNFRLPKLESSRDAFAGELGVRYSVTDRLMLEGNYEGSFNNRFMNHSLKLKLSYEF